MSSEQAPYTSQGLVYRHPVKIGADGTKATVTSAAGHPGGALLFLNNEASIPEV